MFHFGTLPALIRNAGQKKQSKGIRLVEPHLHGIYEYDSDLEDDEQPPQEDPMSETEDGRQDGGDDDAQLMPQVMPPPVTTRKRPTETAVSPSARQRTKRQR